MLQLPVLVGWAPGPTEEDADRGLEMTSLGFVRILLSLTLAFTFSSAL